MNELTRAELIEKICLTDAVCDCNQGNCSSSCDKCEDVLNYLIDRYDAKVRAGVLDEFREKINDYLRDSIEFADFVVTDGAIDCVIEKMKGEQK